MGRIPLRDGSDEDVREVDEADPGVLFELLERIARSAPRWSDDDEDPG